MNEQSKETIEKKSLNSEDEKVITNAMFGDWIDMKFGFDDDFMHGLCLMSPGAE